MLYSYSFIELHKVYSSYFYLYLWLALSKQETCPRARSPWRFRFPRPKKSSIFFGELFTKVHFCLNKEENAVLAICWNRNLTKKPLKCNILVKVTLAGASSSSCSSESNGGGRAIQVLIGVWKKHVRFLQSNCWYCSIR